MSFSDWLANGWLIEHKSTRSEITGLLTIIDRDLAECELAGLSTDWRFNIAYNSALQCALCALAASGYRPAREAHHYRALQSLLYTLELADEEVALLDTCRKKRNLSEYNRAGAISDKEAYEILDFAVSLRARLLGWLQAKYPMLLDL